IANWVINELLRELHGRSIDDVPFGGTELAEMVALIDEGVISGKIAKDVFAEMIKNGGSPSAIVEAKGLKQVSDTGALEAAVQKVLDANPDAIEKYKNGKTNITGFLVGQIMKETRGKANPKMVNELLTKKLPEPAVE
ncbi:Asp-tRNA(Asn)/Glu-tRNA(Gln) amidotransferase GatCAB subunit B, partial [Myxococcota bacterium]|nr:Asp-tRNA(Asn)/Glu-tRNA(Gln) amidotransferase GatCAB subunit B [Myxococcota bacterium]